MSELTVLCRNWPFYVGIVHFYVRMCRNCLYYVGIVHFTSECVGIVCFTSECVGIVRFMSGCVGIVCFMWECVGIMSECVGIGIFTHFSHPYGGLRRGLRGPDTAAEDATAEDATAEISI